MKRQLNFSFLRLLSLLSLSILLQSCWIEEITGPQKVLWGKKVTYDVEVKYGDSVTSSWYAHIGVDVPIGWELKSSYYWGLFYYTKIYGIPDILEGPFVGNSCMDTWPVVPRGYKRYLVVSERHSQGDPDPITPVYFNYVQDTVNTKLLFKVKGRPGRKILGFHLAIFNYYSDENVACDGPEYYPVRVDKEQRFSNISFIGNASNYKSSDYVYDARGNLIRRRSVPVGEIFADGFESGDTSAWVGAP